MPGHALAPAASPEDIRRATELAEERYTAARRRYTHLYLGARSQARPGADEIAELKAASDHAVEMAAALRKVQEGDSDAIRASLAADPVSDEERALTTDRFTIAQMHAAAFPAPTGPWTPDLTQRARD